MPLAAGVVAGLLVTALVFGSVHGLTLAFGFTLLGVALLFTCILGYWMMTRARLDISPEGITYHAIGYKVHSTWPNIIGIEKRVHGAFEPESLILREAAADLRRGRGVAWGGKTYVRTVR